MRTPFVSWLSQAYRNGTDADDRDQLSSFAVS